MSCLFGMILQKFIRKGSIIFLRIIGGIWQNNYRCMDLYIKNVIIIVLGNLYYKQVCSVLIWEGYIQKIGEIFFEKEDVFLLEVEGLYLLIGWMDFGVQVGDFGLEYCEILYIVGVVVVVGGFMVVVVFFNMDLVIDFKFGVQYIS